jgi:hypothetical protein
VVDIYNLGKLLWMMLASKDEAEMMVCAREEWAESQNDLINIRRDIDMKYVNDLILSKTVVKEPGKRLQEVGHVITRMERIVDLLTRGFEPIQKQGMTCKFCGQGTYNVVVERTNYTPAMFASGLPVDTLTRFGFTPQERARWRILACTDCGHIQLFRFDHRYDENDPEW